MLVQCLQCGIKYMKIIPVESGPVNTIGYLIIDEQTKDGIIIDAPLDSSSIFFANAERHSVRLRALLLTHSHWDHIADCFMIKEKTNLDIYIHKNDEYRLTEPNKHTIWPLPFEIKPVKADKYFESEQKLTFGSLSFDVLFTPGHTEGGVCLYNSENKLVFTGDTLFNMSIGRVDLPGGNYEILMNSIEEKLMKLDDEIQVYSGHGEATSIGFERRNNPFLAV